MKKLYIVVPCYNEEAVLPVTAPIFKKKIEQLVFCGKISPESRVLFVNDGSKDKTWEIISSLAKEDETFEGICLSRNRGHQNALLAGLTEAKDKCDVTISIDCDGQDDINAMDEMLDKFEQGNDIVYGVRSSRKTDTFLKRFTALSFYKLMTRLGAETVYNHADYRLVSSKVLKEFASFEEVNLFLRGMFPLVGFSSTSVFYERAERLAGESHYPLSKMLNLAINGITSLSAKPIRMVFFAGVLFSLLGFGGIIASIVLAIAESALSGWLSIISTIVFFSGLLLVSVGIVGEYVGKTYMETKKRPRFIISERTEE